MARWMWRPWVYATGIPQIAWTVRQIRRFARDPYPVRKLAKMDEHFGGEWVVKPLASAQTWMVVVVRRRDRPVAPARVNIRTEEAAE